MSEGVVHVSSEGRIVYANPAAERLLGYAAGELAGRQEHDLLHRSKADGSPYPIDRCPIHATLRDHRVHHASGEMFWRKDGAGVPVEYTSAPLHDSDGGVGAVIVFADNGDRGRAAEIERKTQERVSRIYDAMPEAYVALDRDWRIVYANPAADKLPQPREGGAIRGHVLWDRFPELRGTAFEERYRRAMIERAPARFEALHERSGRWFDVAAYPTDEGLGVHLRDVTERKRAEEQARAASIARPLARKIVQDLVEMGGVAHQILTQVGRNIAGETSSKTLEEFVGAFAEMGFGQIKVDRVEGPRYTFRGADLLEKRPNARATTCAFTLGFLSEAVSRVHRQEPTLGAEIECQSRGAAECRFVVQVKKPEEGLARRVKELV